MSPLALTLEEESFVKAVEMGKRRVFSMNQTRPIGERRVSIRAEVIARVILRKDLKFSNGQIRPVVIKTAGVQLSGAKITGNLNLDDASGPEFTPLSRLSLQYCWFDGAINLRRSHFTSLSFRGSRFRVLNASDAFIKGPVDLTGICGIEPKSDKGGFETYGQCWVVLATAAIAGRVTAGHARLAAPPPRTPAGVGREEFVRFSRFATYALDLRASNIESSVVLRPDCVAVGGVCIALSKLDGSVWGSGAMLKAGEDYAFCADYAVIRGSIYFRPNDLRPPGDKQPLAGQTSIQSSSLTDDVEPRKSTCFSATGCVSLFACKLGGSLFMEGAKLTALNPAAKESSDKNPEALDVRNSEIGGHCSLCAWESEVRPGDVYRFIARGEIWLGALRVRNELSLSGACIKSLDANNIEVGGDCNCSVTSFDKEKVHYRFVTQGDVKMDGSTIKGNLDFQGAYIGMGNRFERASPGDTESESQSEAITLSVSGTVIGGDCLLRAYGHRCSRMRTHGLRFRSNGIIVLTESKITNSLHMEGAELKAPRDKKTPALDLSGTTIGADACFKTWDDPAAQNSLPFIAEGGSVVLRLTATKIAQKLIMNGARISARPPNDFKASSVYAIDAANAEIGGKASLSTYVGKLAGKEEAFRFGACGEVDFTAARITLGLDLSGSSLSAVQSSGTEAPLALDASRAHLKFIWFKKDEVEDEVGRKVGRSFRADGEIRLEYAEINAEMDLSGAILHEPLSAKYAEIDAEMDLSGAKLYGAFDAEGARIGKSVRLEDTTISRMSTEARLQDPKVTKERKILEEDIFDRHVERKLAPDISFRSAEIGDALIVNRLRVFDLQEGTRPYLKDLTHGTVDLRALHVGDLNDEGGDGWGKDVRFWLDGFRYDRLPEVKPSKHRKSPLQLIVAFLVRVRDPSDLWEKSVENARDFGELRGAWSKVRRRPRSLRRLFTKVQLWLRSPRRLINKAEVWIHTRQPWRLDNTQRFPYRGLYKLLETGGVWEHRLRWLNLQYLKLHYPTPEEYSPDAYEQLINGLNATGSFDSARRIASARLTIEARQHLWLVRKGWAFFRVFYDYGFSIGRAIATFLFCIGLGWTAARVADGRPLAYVPWFPKVTNALVFPRVGDVLIVNTEMPETRIKMGKGGKVAVIPLVPEAGLQFSEKEEPCEGRILPLLYALDVFVPVLDLRQQSVCSIAPGDKYDQDKTAGRGFLDRFLQEFKYRIWHIAQATYAILGWVLTPLTILTISGFLRKHLEK